MQSATSTNLQKSYSISSPVGYTLAQQVFFVSHCWLQILQLLYIQILDTLSATCWMLMRIALRVATFVTTKN